MACSLPSTSTIIIYFSILTLFSLYSPDKFLNDIWDPLVVDTPSGLIQGLREKGYRAFYGIPYALPPTGDLRFKSPEPYPVPWEGILQARRSSPPKCPQKNSFLFYDWSGNEDCLHINIFAPDKASLKSPNDGKEASSELRLFPVMVWIHGGNFNSGGISDYDPVYFMTKDVILVMISFRLGPLGSLYLGTNIRGNQGIEDQRIALSWIHKNIKSFGGDPQRVTIFGESSGAKSVLHHVSNAKSRPYFQSAVVQSGVIDWMPDLLEENIIEMHKAWSDEMGCGHAIDTEACLQRIPLSQIMESDLFLSDCNLKKSGHPSPNPWIPLLESKNTLCDSNLHKKVQGLKLMVGITSNEGKLATSSFMFENNRSDAFMHKWEECLESNLGNVNIEAAMKFYFDNVEEPDFPSQIQNFSNLISDFWFNGPTLKTVEALSNAGSSPYYYIYDHDGFITMADQRSQSSLDYWLFVIKYALGMEAGKTNGAAHADELPFLFRDYPLNLLKRPEDEKMWRLMIDLWTNFATYGNPNGQDKDDALWEPASKSNLYKYARLKNGEILSPTIEEINLRRSRLQFWNSTIMNEQSIVIK